MIAKNKAGGNTLHVTDMVKNHAAGNPKRHKAIGLTKAANLPAHDVKVAYFQEAHPIRHVTQKRVRHERNPNSSDFKDCE